MWLLAVYIILSVVMGVSAMYRGSVYAGAAGIVGSVLCWFSGSGLKGSLLAATSVRKLGRLLAAITFAVVGMGIVYQSGYSMQILGYGLTGVTWCAIGLVLGYIVPAT